MLVVLGCVRAEKPELSSLPLFQEKLVATSDVNF